MKVSLNEKLRFSGFNSHSIWKFQGNSPRGRIRKWHNRAENYCWVLIRLEESSGLNGRKTYSLDYLACSLWSPSLHTIPQIPSTVFHLEHISKSSAWNCFPKKGKLFNYVCSLNIYPQEPLLQQQCCIPFTLETRAAARMVQNYNWNFPKQECAFVKLEKFCMHSRLVLQI